MTALITKITDFIDKVIDISGKVLSLLVLIMFALVITEVIRRYFFNAPSVWGSELTQMIFGAYIVLAGAYVHRWDNHVNVDIFYGRFSEKRKALFDVITFIMFFLFCLMLMIYGGSLAWESISTFEHSGSAWDPPIYIIKLMIPLGAFLLLIVGISKLFKNILKIFGK